MTIRSEDRKKKFFIPKLFSTRENKGRTPNEVSFDSSVELERDLTFSDTSSILKKDFSGTHTTSRLGELNFSGLESSMSNVLDIQSIRVFVATWNVGGKPPHRGLNLDHLLRVEEESDIYVLGFQEIVPLNAGNVLVIEDNEPAVKWLALINQALNKPLGVGKSNTPKTTSLGSIDSKPTSSLLFFHKPSLKTVSKSFKTERGRRLKTCNCPSELERKNSKDSCFKFQQAYVSEEESSSEEDEGSNNFLMTNIDQLKYSLIASKQMVGIFVSIWAKKELVQHVGHLRVSCIGRGIMGWLGNKGCISVSMSLHHTSFCFVCSHLASGEKEGDELRRNYDVLEILKNTQFPKICKIPNRRIPEKILEHDRVIWFGDLNYRIALSYSETRKLLEENDWDTLLNKDQLKIERDAGRVFNGWKEGKIYFAPTYKYSNNSDVYAGETFTSKKKRRTPAWCDRILWHGSGIKQLSYKRVESKFSDHRPVCAVFDIEVGVLEGRSKKGLSNMKVEIEELLPTSTRYLVSTNYYVNVGRNLMIFLITYEAYEKKSAEIVASQCGLVE